MKIKILAFYFAFHSPFTIFATGMTPYPFDADEKRTN